EPGERFVDREFFDDQAATEGAPLRPGSRVVHARFGEGEVRKVERSADPAVIAFFPGWGEKKILVRFLKILAIAFLVGSLFPMHAHAETSPRADGAPKELAPLEDYTTWDLAFEGGYGAVLPHSGQSLGFGRARTGVTFARGVLFYTVGATYEWSTLQPAT